jgi:2,3-bisphosphoglycerate-dependent phosphoglycerate mutase
VKNVPHAEGLLVLLRHNRSEWNLKTLFTGWRNPGLTEARVLEAIEAGRRLNARGIGFDLAITAALTRARHTLMPTLAQMGQTGLPESRDQALNERHYSDLWRQNKVEARRDQQLRLFRRSYDLDRPSDESLRDTVVRTIPYYCQHILTAVLGENQVLDAGLGKSCVRLSWCLTALRLRPFQLSVSDRRTARPTASTQNLTVALE